MKIKAASAYGRRIEKVFSTERTALGVLRGLAVPQVFDMRLSEVPFMNGNHDLALGLSEGRAAFLIETYEGETFHEHRSTKRMQPHTIAGVWLFCLEQFVAFRRHQLLYTDIKCHNVVISSGRPRRVVIVDFDRIVPLASGSGWQNFGATRDYEPPELRSGPPSEASCVYQLALLLVHFLANGDNRTLRDENRGLPKVAAVLHRAGAAPLFKLVESSLRNNPRQRPRDYEAMLGAVKRMNIPSRSLRVWRELRAPYVSRLAEIGLEGM